MFFLLFSFRYIIDGRNKFERSVWATVLSAAVAYTSILIRQSLDEASANPIVTSTESISVQELPFPAVTIGHGKKNR